MFILKSNLLFVNLQRSRVSAQSWQRLSTRRVRGAWPRRRLGWGRNPGGSRWWLELQKLSWNVWCRDGEATISSHSIVCPKKKLNALWGKHKRRGCRQTVKTTSVEDLQVEMGPSKRQCPFMWALQGTDTTAVLCGWIETFSLYIWFFISSADFWHETILKSEWSISPWWGI